VWREGERERERGVDSPNLSYFVSHFEKQAK
jgi:hypothetical protein